LIPKGEKFGSKQEKYASKASIFQRGSIVFQKGRNAKSIQEGVANRGRNKGGIKDLGRGQADIGWW